MIKIRNGFYAGSNQRSSLIDVQLPDGFNGNLLVFVHGYMGFKDWGAWNQMQDFFVSKGYGYCKFNMSHNGGTTENGIDFPDLDAFSENTYSKEVVDLGCVLDFLEKQLDKLPKITLIGHSRGGGICLLKAQDKRVSQVITLASISSVEKRFSDQDMLKKWKEDGIRFHPNQRTKQEMPHSYAQVIDFLVNRKTLSIRDACLKLEKPVLLIHGKNDLSVPVSEGQELAEWTKSNLQLIEDADHVFGASQPWNRIGLPEKLEEVCGKIELFLM